MATYWENSCSFGLRYVSWYKYLIVSLVFSHLGFWSGNLFLIAPFPDLCLCVPFCGNMRFFRMCTKLYKYGARLLLTLKTANMTIIIDMRNIIFFLYRFGCTRIEKTSNTA